MSSDITRPPAGETNLKSRHRLADISHHFLSDANEHPPVWQNTRVVPVLLGTRNDDYIVYQLERGFNQHGYSSMVLNIEGRQDPSRALRSKISEHFSAQALKPGAADRLLPDICLVPVTAPATTLALRCERLIITAHASLPGIRLAYNQLSFLASLKTNFKVCIFIHGARTATEAQRFFNFLRSNAQSMLHLELESGGYLLRNQGVEAESLHRVGRFIASQAPAANAGAKSARAHAGPAAYLS